MPSIVFDLIGTEVTVVASEPGPLVKEFRSLSPDCRLGFVLGPPLYRHAVMIGFGKDDKPHLAGKLVHGARSEESLARETSLLRAVAKYPALAGTAPSVLASGQMAQGGTYLVTNLFLGAVPPETLTLELQDWLRRCVQPQSIQVKNSEIVRRIAANLDEAPEHAHELRSLYMQALGRVGDTVVRTTVTHGDFIPWNMTLSTSGLRVFDWEYASLDGIPGWDQAYFQLQVGLIRRGWDPRRLVDEVARMCAASPEPYGKDEFRAVISLVLIDSISRLPVPDNPPHRVRVLNSLRQLAVESASPNSRRDGER